MFSGDSNLETFLIILPYLAVFVCVALFAIPALWGAVFTFSLFGHLTQIIFKGETTVKR